MPTSVNVEQLTRCFWPPDLFGQAICGAILLLFVVSFFVLWRCACYRRRRAQEMLDFLQKTLSEGILGGIPEGLAPDASSSDTSQLDWWVRELPSCECVGAKARGALNASLARGDWYKLSGWFSAWLNFLTEACSLYPMLGILGTVVGVYSALDPENLNALINSFSTAVITTIWGIVFGIAHTLIMSFWYARLHELDEYPAKIDKALYDLKQNIHRSADSKNCEEHQTANSAEESAPQNDEAHDRKTTGKGDAKCDEHD